MKWKAFGKISAVVSVVCVMILLMIDMWLCNRRPLFHLRYTSEDSLDIPFLPYWRENSFVTDREGAIAFADYDVNMFVVVVTDNKAIGGHGFIRARPLEAVLLVGSPYEQYVQSQVDTLIIIEGNTRRSFPIEAGQGRAWHQHMVRHTNYHGWTMLGEIAQSYQGEGKAAIEELATRFEDRASSEP